MIARVEPRIQSAHLDVELVESFEQRVQLSVADLLPLHRVNSAPRPRPARGWSGRRPRPRRGARADAPALPAPLRALGGAALRRAAPRPRGRAAPAPP